MHPTARLLSITQPVSGLDLAGISKPMDLIEYAGRVDYGKKSIAKMGDREIIKRWIDSGHQSMIEMIDATFSIECSRVVSHELVRHRLASFQQESQRYVKYDESTPDELFFMPDEIEINEEAAEVFREATAHALAAYQKLKDLGLKSQFARYVLPNATKTRIIMKSNLREWRHILLLRMHSSAQPEVQELGTMIWLQLMPHFPEIFGDLPAILAGGERQIR